MPTYSLKQSEGPTGEAGFGPPGAPGANTSLSNLVPTAINQDLIPDGNGTRRLGDEGLPMLWESLAIAINIWFQGVNALGYDDGHGLRVFDNTVNHFHRQDYQLLTGDHLIQWPDKDGTVAMLSDVPPPAPVTSVNGHVGVVNLIEADIPNLIADLNSKQPVGPAGTKVQGAAGTVNIAQITLANAVDGAAGRVKFVILATNGAESWVCAGTVHYACARGAGGTTANVSSQGGAGGVAIRAIAQSAAGVFNENTPSVLVSVAGNIVTIAIQTVDATGAQTSAVIEYNIQDYSNHAVVLL